MRCIIASPEEEREIKDVSSVTLPAPSGELQILPGHAESFIAVRNGRAFFVSGGKTEAAQIKEGVCRVKDDVVYIII